MRGWCITQDNNIVIRHNFDLINDPAIFLDRASALRAKETIFPQSEYEIIEVDIQIEVKPA